MKYLSTVLFVENLSVSKDFYARIMGLEVESEFDKNVIFKCGLTLWEIEASHVILRNLNVKGNVNSLELYFEDEHLTLLVKNLEDAKFRILHGVQEEPWGQRTIRFFDPDGHLIEVGEPVDVFIRNMRTHGLSYEEIEKRSGVPLEMVLEILMRKV